MISARPQPHTTWPDRGFFDHVKVLRPFPVDGYDLHAIGSGGATGFWSESYSPAPSTTRS